MEFEVHLLHLCRYCCQTWLMQMMMNQLLKLRLSFGLISSYSWISITSCLYDFICLCNVFSQEDGSQPDRDQVWLFLSWLNGFSLIWDHHISNFVCFAPQDLKPRFHVSRFHGSDEVEDDVCCTYSIDCLF